MIQLFEEYGPVVEVKVLRDFMGISKGCAFVFLQKKEQADAAVAALHNKRTLPGV